MDELGQGAPHQQPAMALMGRQPSSQSLGDSSFVGHHAEEVELTGLCHLCWRIGAVANAHQCGGNVVGDGPAGLVDEGHELIEARSSHKHQQIAVFNEFGSGGVRPYSANVNDSVDVVKAAKAICQSLRQ